MCDSQAILFRLPWLNFIDDKIGKPIGINERIAGDRRAIWASAASRA